MRNLSSMQFRRRRPYLFHANHHVALALNEGPIACLDRNMNDRTLKELQQLETLWRRCAKGWHFAHWLLLATNLGAAAVMLIGPKVAGIAGLLEFSSIYVPVSTLAIATLKPSSRATTFIVAYRILYFALLRHGEGLISMKQLIAEAERAEVVISKNGYAPNVSDLQPGSGVLAPRSIRSDQKPAQSG